MTQTEYWIWLTTRAGSNAAICRALLQRFRTPEAIWKATREQLTKIPRMSRVRLDALCDKDLVWPGRIAEDCQRLDISIVTWDDANYPAPLRELPDSPPLLYVRGKLPDFENKTAIAIVGTRRATDYGMQAARQFAGTLAHRGCIIVSGMALGIDGAANRAAIDAGGETVAVFGCGADVCYPWQHEPLMKDIIRHGAVISEYPPGTEPNGWRFPQRNRIITGLSQGTLIVEAPKKSGALISAELALEQGRDVFAIPGDIGRPSSEGCNDLIRQGAAELVQRPSEILAHYRIDGSIPFPANRRRQTEERKLAAPSAIRQKRSAPPEAQPESTDSAEQPGKPAAAHPAAPAKTAAKPLVLKGSEQERTVWRTVRNGCISVDAIVEKSGLSAAAVLTALTGLEIGGFVLRDSGGYHSAENVVEQPDA